MPIDIYIILISTCGVLLCAVLIAQVILIARQSKTGTAGENKLLQEQILSLNKTLDSKLSQGNQTLQHGMSQSLKTGSMIADTANKNIESITRKLTELSATNSQIKEIWNRLEGLEHILKNPKRRGNLGEYFLKELLENVFTPEQYGLQYPLSKGFVDAALFIGKKVIPIDAKFPQENYEKLVASEDELSIKKHSSELKKDIKKRIDETSKYILPEENTTDFAFMLIPAEGVYYDIFINKIGDFMPSELIEYGFSKKVIICSPSWFYAYLQTVLQWMKSLQIEEHAKEIQKYVLKLQKDMHKYEEVFAKVWNSLGTTVGHYNAASKRLRMIDSDILKISPESKLKLAPEEETSKPELS